MGTRIRILAGLAAAAALPVTVGCVAPQESRGPDPEAREQIHRIANHLEELTAGFHQRGRHLEEVTERLHRFMERVERLEVAVHHGGGAGGEPGHGPGPGDMEGLARRLEEMERMRDRLRGELEELEGTRNRLREQVKELEEHRREMEGK